MRKMQRERERAQKKMRELSPYQGSYVQETSIKNLK